MSKQQKNTDYVLPVVLLGCAVLGAVHEFSKDEPYSDLTLAGQKKGWLESVFSGSAPDPDVKCVVARKPNGTLVANMYEVKEKNGGHILSYGSERLVSSQDAEIWLAPGMKGIFRAASWSHGVYRDAEDRPHIATYKSGYDIELTITGWTKAGAQDVPLGVCALSHVKGGSMKGTAYDARPIVLSDRHLSP